MPENNDANPAQPVVEANAAMPEGRATAEGDAMLLRLAPAAADAIAIPENYTLQAYDDCGITDRQPHLVDVSNYVFAEAGVEGPPRSLTVAFGPTGSFIARYEGLDEGVPCLVAVTYADEENGGRVQELHAGAHELHAARKLPQGRAERATFRVPAEAIQDGTLELTFKLVEGPNPVVSEIELWAPLPAPGVIRIEPALREDNTLMGRITGLSFDPLANVSVSARPAPNAAWLPGTQSGPDGVFTLQLPEGLKIAADDTIELAAEIEGHKESLALRADTMVFFRPVYHPIAAEIAGLDTSDLLLDGAWRVHATAPENFERNGATTGESWATFNVPGQLLQQGFTVTPDSEFALVHEFTIPQGWADRPLFLRFDAVHGQIEYFLNGVRLGDSDMIYTPIEFDITAAARVGQTNRLALRLRTDPKDALDRLATSTGYCHHNPGGIHRSVRVFALPQTHLSRAWIDPRVDASLERGELYLELAIENGDADAVRITLLNSARQPVKLATSEFTLGDLQPGKNERTFRCPVERPRLWSAETPVLYDVELALMRDGRPIETIRRAIGFRRIEVKGNKLLVNGQPVKLFGVNRHEIDPLTGRADTVRHAETDARLFKEANCNYIRTSHYPPTREFLEACDRIGLYVECEAPFVWTHKEPEEDDAFHLREFLEPTASMAEYHQGHASIAFWSLGNESGWPAKQKIGIPCNYRATNAYLKRVDPARPTAFNNSWGNDDNQCDIAVIHYPPPDDFSKMLTFPDDPRPVLIDEYLHVMCYNVDELRVDPGGIIEEWAQLGMHRFGSNNNCSFWDPGSTWNRIYNSERYLGLAIWAGIDEVFHFPNDPSNGYGPWGLIDGWRRRKPEFYHTQMMYSRIWIPQREVAYNATTGLTRVAIENRYAFTDLAGIQVRWSIEQASGPARLDSIAPRTTGTLELQLPTGVARGTPLRLDFMDEIGNVAATWGLDVGQAPAREIAVPDAGAPEWKREGDLLKITGDDFALTLNTATGEFIKTEGAPPLLTFPTIHCTQAERKMVFTPTKPPYLEMPDASTRMIESVEAEVRDHALAITLTERYGEFAGKTEWLIDRTGRGVVSFDYVYSGQARELREVGVKFLLDASCQTLSWKRRGLWGIYPTDHVSRLAGSAAAHRTDAGADDTGVRPNWSWRLDESELGTQDFRSTKHGIHDAQLANEAGGGVSVEANADANVRACLTQSGVALHVVRSGQATQVETDTHLSGRFHVRLRP